MTDMTRNKVPPLSTSSSYGVYREEPKGGGPGGWAVHIWRNGHSICRRFKDQIHGSSEAALAMATAYRDEILAAFPPLTNREIATRLRRNNKSGISGVYRSDTRAGGEWGACIDLPDGFKRKRFSVRKYGEAGAKAKALAQREEWLADLPGRFLGNNEELSSRAGQLFADRLERVPEALPHDPPLSRADIKAKLAEINARFDALRPPRLKVRVRPYSHLYTVYVSDLGRPARSKQTSFYRANKSPEDVLARVPENIKAGIDHIYHVGVTRWFMGEYGTTLLDPARFDPDEGFIVDVWVPPELVRAASVAMKD